MSSQILEYIQGVKLVFNKTPKPNVNTFKPYSDKSMLSECVKDLVKSGVIEKATSPQSHFFITLFLNRKA